MFGCKTANTKAVLNSLLKSLARPLNCSSWNGSGNDSIYACVCQRMSQRDAVLNSLLAAQQWAKWF